VTRKHLSAAIVIGGAVWLAGAGIARADLGLVFSRPTAESGAVVEAVSAERSGRLEVFPPIRHVRVYFVPMMHARSPRHQRPTGVPDDPLWIPLGPLRHARSGVIRFRFTVPDVPPGDYTIGFWCRQCAAPKGATFTSAYPGTEWTSVGFAKVIRVVRRRAHAAGAATGTSTRVPLTVALAALVLVGALATLRCKRRGAD
jgi:hypothetical protein